MAQTVNSTVPFGLRPIRHLNGSPWNGQTRKYLVEDAYGTAMFLGDAVKLTTTAPSDDPSGIYPAVNRVTVGDGYPILGVVTSFDPIDAAGVEHKEVYRVASTSRYVNLVVDPDVVFIIRDDGEALLTGDECTENAVLIDTGSGNTNTGWSNIELDATSDAPEANASNQLLILGIWPAEDNVLAIHCIWEVIISVHAYRCQTGITGV